MLHLGRYRPGPRIAIHRHLLRSGPSLDSSASAVIAYPAPAILGYTVVVDIANYRGVDARYRLVVVNTPVVPVRAIIAPPRVPMPVIDAAVVSDVRRPIPAVPAVMPIFVAPPWRRPQTADVRRKHPGSVNPVIADSRMRPVAGRPYVVVARCGRLLVSGMRRRWFGRGHVLCGCRVRL